MSKDIAVEIKCGEAWKKVVNPDTYSSDGKQRHSLEQGIYTDNGCAPKEIPTLDDHA